MPERILRNWTDSSKFENLSAESERLFVRIIMSADDFGRFHGDSRLIKAACFPLQDNLRTNEVDRWLDELSTRQLVLCYEVCGRKLLAIVNFRQRLRTVRAKFPPPAEKCSDWLASDGDPLPSVSNPPQSAAGCRQTADNPPQSAASLEEKRREVEEKEKKEKRERVREDVCSLEQALSYAKAVTMPPISEECARAWHDHQLSVGWQINNMPIHDWQAALRRWASKWNTNNQGNQGNKKTVTTGKPQSYLDRHPNQKHLEPMEENPL